MNNPLTYSTWNYQFLEINALTAKLSHMRYHMHSETTPSNLYTYYDDPHHKNNL